MPEKDRPSLQEVAQKHKDTTRLAGMRFGEEQRRLRKEEINIYSEAVALTARTLLENKGEDEKKNLLNEVAGHMFVSSENTVEQERNFILAVAVRMGEIVNPPLKRNKWLS